MLMNKGQLAAEEASSKYQLAAKNNGLRKGYKQTEVGVIPENWDIQKISYLLEDKSILDHLDGNHGELYPRSSEFKQNGVPYIGANDFVNNLVSFDNCKFLSKERASKFKKGIAKDGDVLFAHNATVGPVALLRTSEPFVILSTTATYFRCNEEKLHYLFLKFALQSSYFIKQYQAVMAQSTRFQVPITTQRKLSLVTPPLNEQRAIAIVLSDVDALLAKLDQLITKKRDLKQATMQQLLTGQTRLPGFSGEWKAKQLGDITEIVMGQSPSSLNYISKGIGLPLIQGNADILDRKTIKQIFTTEITKNRKCGDILISVRAPVGEISRALFDVCLGRGVCAIRYPNDFMYHYLVSERKSRF